MARKPKKPDNGDVKSNGDPNSVSGSGSSDIFKSLFGNIPEQQTSVSIFSAGNPFRRKPGDRSQRTLEPERRKEQVGLELGSAGGVENRTNIEDEEPIPVDVKKRKRNKEKKSSLKSGSIDEISDTPSEIKKSRKGYSEERGEERDDDLGSRSKDSLKRGKGKKHNFAPESKEASERDKGKDQDLGLESEERLERDGTKKQNMGMELNGTVNLDEKGAEKKKKKKKRKRDELEADYEVRRYGVVTTNDEGGDGELGKKIVGEKRKKADGPVEMEPSKEGFDDEEKLLRTVFVGNLSLKVKKKALFKEFSQFGEVESVRIRSVPLLDTKTPRKGAVIQKKINEAVDSVHAYVVFKTEQAAQASLTHNMAVVGGNHIRVDRACPPRKKLKGDNTPLYENKRTIFVGNLPFDVKDEEIYQLFSGIKDLESSVEAIRVVRDPGTSMGKGIAYIMFKTRGAANLVAKKRSLKLRDRELRLCHAKSNLTPSKRKNLLPGVGNDSPGKKLAFGFKTPESNKLRPKGPSPYQGLRASKSGVQKKVHSQIMESGKLRSTTQKREKVKERMNKRPAVAARKANALKGGGGSKHTGKKRKVESRTPEGGRPNKKVKKVR